jgi:hypothetical protein
MFDSRCFAIGVATGQETDPAAGKTLPPSLWGNSAARRAGRLGLRR